MTVRPRRRRERTPPRRRVGGPGVTGAPGSGPGGPSPPKGRLCPPGEGFSVGVTSVRDTVLETSVMRQGVVGTLRS